MREMVRGAYTSEPMSLQYQLAPQMRVYHLMPEGPWMPLVMRCGALGFRSEVVNTDKFGVRHTTTQHHGAVCCETTTGAELSLLVGGSTAFGVGSTSDSTTLPAYLTDMSGEAWMNMGKRAWTLNQCLAFGFTHAQLMPRVRRIVLFAGLNEIAVFLQSSRIPRQYGAFFGWNALDAAFNRDTVGEDYAIVAKKRLVDEPATRELAIESIEGTLAGWRVFANGLNAQLSFALQPFADWCTRESSPEEQALFNALDVMQNNTYAELRRPLRLAYRWWAPRLRTLCLKQGIPFIDCNDIFSGGSTSGQWCFVDRAHLTDRGHELCATAIGNVCRTGS